jgi:hypothetical protein
VLPTRQTGTSWFLANAFDADDVNLAVPLHSMTRPEPAFDLEMVGQLGAYYPDQEVVSAICGRSIRSKNSWPSPSTLFGTNHGSGIASWFFVNKANEGYKKGGQMFGFEISVCPPIYPAFYSPTGAVHKTDRLGNIDPLNMRPTADYSWPASGHWMEWLTSSVNSSIDLERDFPWVAYASYKDIAGRALQLAALGEPVV